MTGMRRWLKSLRWRLRGTRFLWLSSGRQRSQTPFDFVVLPGGRIDVPAAGEELPRGPVAFEGWAMFESGPAARVELWLDGEFAGRARLGLGRPDIRARSGQPRGMLTGFAHTIDLADHASAAETLAVRVVATGVEGERLELPPASFRLSASPRSAPAQPSPIHPVPDHGEGRAGRRIVIFTHRLDYGGAQTYLVQLARGLLSLGGIEITVASTANGPLREQLCALGVEVHVSTAAPIDDPHAHLGRVEELTAWAAGRGFELVLLNTATSLVFPGAEVAMRLGIPAVWAIHESFPPPVLWKDLHPQVRQLGEAALADATTAIFEAEATRRLYEPWVGGERCRTIPYGLDLEPIDEVRRGFDRGAARRSVGLEEDAEVVLCVGAVEPRKAQVPLAQAFDLIAERHPKARLVFVGGRQNPDGQLLEGCIAALASGDRMTLVPMTAEVQRWYGLADLLVCASDIESLPRVVLEGMAWELPVLATAVFGLPELIEDGVSGWLCEERDVLALAAGLERALAAAPGERREIGRRGRQLVESRHPIGGYCEQVAAILADVAAATRAA